MSFQTKQVNHQPQETTLSPSKEAGNTDKRIERLFLRFGSIYGHLWSSIYRTEEFINCTKREWREALVFFDNRVLGSALEHCRQQEAYPPTLPKFIELCKSQVKRNDFFSIEETQRCDPAIARRYLENIRAILNKPARGKQQ